MDGGFGLFDAGDEHLLDDATAARLLRGELGPDDAPPPYRHVAGTVRELRRAQSGASSAQESSVVAAMAEQILASAPMLPTSTTARSNGTRRRAAQLVAVGAVAGFTLWVGFASANALPGAAQRVASAVLGKIGISVPSPDDTAAVHPDFAWGVDRGAGSARGHGAGPTRRPHRQR
jgi:hypothetical protein